MNCASAANSEAFNAVSDGLLDLSTGAQVLDNNLHHHNDRNAMPLLPEQQLALTCTLAAFTSRNLSPLPPASLSTDSASVAMLMKLPPSTAASSPYSAVYSAL